MFRTASGDDSALVKIALLAGVVMPVAYFAIQAAIAPSYPEYDFTRDVASKLGSPASPLATVFNAVVVAIGVMALVAGLGQIARLLSRGVNPLIALAAGLCVISVGAGTIWSGLVPMPDPAHGASSPFMLAAVIYPAIMLVILRRSPGWRLVLAAALIGVAGSAAVMMGLTGIDRMRWAGAIQRPVALALLTPIGLASFALLRNRIRPA